jgi:hypothetical protein
MARARINDKWQTSRPGLKSPRSPKKPKSLPAGKAGPKEEAELLVIFQILGL